jgi:hypothetical protein
VVFVSFHVPAWLPYSSMGWGCSLLLSPCFIMQMDAHYSEVTRLFSVGIFHCFDGFPHSSLVLLMWSNSSKTSWQLALLRAEQTWYFLSSHLSSQVADWSLIGLKLMHFGFGNKIKFQARIWNGRTFYKGFIFSKF